MQSKDIIKTFVRETLGCNCPEEVFNRIEQKSNIPLGNLILNHRINIGNRLLIYIFEVENEESLHQILPFLIESGRVERDEFGFNRFRLVLAQNTERPVNEIAQEIFDNINRDEKIHLHVISKRKISF
ncbi:MAG: hypothetical protein AB1390_06330 [Nitrospirota bacterium]